ncbi:hypothetical protein CF326_g3723 [Tilletia indica]|uniref:Roadblock/LAMTOR2 domain-containing protein n=1 Tax=Tilletia indica TaxID=43049 RepID=A0A177T7F1_9BASI|nr:hypothetical protein CF326_g3723 [Tilletia indica]KAE8250345.1 hypothetical protein A4X13_0g4803 [Tilletia indica]
MTEKALPDFCFTASTSYNSTTLKPALTSLAPPVSLGDQDRELRVAFSPIDIQRKPHDLSTAPPPPGSPMPPSAGILYDEEGSEYASVDETRSALSSDDEDEDTDTVDEAASGSSIQIGADQTGDDGDATTIAPRPSKDPFESIPQEPLPWDIESTLSKITTTHRSVTGTLVLTRTDCAIVRATGPAFDPSGPGSHERGTRLIRLVKMVKRIMAVVDEEVQHVDEENEMDLLRVRSKFFEALITPGELPFLNPAEQLADLRRFALVLRPEIHPGGLPGPRFANLNSSSQI